MRNSRRKADWSKAHGPWSCQIIAATPVGAVAVVSRGKTLLAVEIGFSTQAQARRHIRKRWRDVPLAWSENEGGRQVKEYFSGRRRSFDLHPVLDSLGPFHQRVLKACARIPFGEVRSYGDLARAAGSPRAFRAAGQALRSNPCAIVIPCHRVVAAGGIGGFSARGGVRTKRALLAFEGISRPALKARFG